MSYQRLQLSFIHLLAPMVLAAISSTGFAGIAMAQPQPAIERIEPTSGPVGTELDIIGRRIPPGADVLLGTTPLEVVRRLPNRWTVRIVAGAQSGRIAIRSQWGAREVMTQGPEFRVVAAALPPLIERLEPASGAPGGEVTIHGQNFSTRLMENTVLLGDKSAVVRTATPFALRVVVPEGAATSPFVVRVGQAGEARSPQPFAVLAPTAIADFQPRIGPPGTRVTITGTGFSADVRQNRVFINSTPVRVETASATRLVVSVPANAATGQILVDVRDAGRVTSPAPFVVQLPPSITAFEPIAAPPGRLVTLRGTNFGTDIRAVQVTLAGRPATVRNLASTELSVEVPLGANTGRFAVTVSSLGPGTAPLDFTVLVPIAITDFQPRSGPAGTVVAIAGAGFSARLAENTVTLSGAATPLVSATSSELRIRVPAAVSGLIEVTTLRNGTARAAVPFVVTAPPTIAGFLPARGAPGTEVRLRGASFGANASVVEVKLGETPMTVRSVTGNEIVAVVPDNAGSGKITVSVRLQGSAATAAPFEYLPAFRMAAIEPATGHPGIVVSLRGLGFVPAGMTVVFAGGQPLAATFVGPAELRAVVPASATTGPVTVRHPDGRAEAVPGVFTVAPLPAGVGITAVEPVCTRPGCVVIVRGYGFSARANQNRVFFGEAPVRVRRATSLELELNLPARPGTAPFRVDVRGAGQATTAPFTITQQ